MSDRSNLVIPLASLKGPVARELEKALDDIDAMAAELRRLRGLEQAVRAWTSADAHNDDVVESERVAELTAEVSRLRGENREAVEKADELRRELRASKVCEEDMRAVVEAACQYVDAWGKRNVPGETEAWYRAKYNLTKAVDAYIDVIGSPVIPRVGSFRPACSAPRRESK